MDPSPAKDQAKQIRLSIFINSAMAIYAICTFINALQMHVAWRVLCAGIGSVFFVGIAIMQIKKLISLRKAD
jgi:hypothetical protein